MKKTYKVHELSSFKALPDLGEGMFEAIVSVFGNIDHMGDRVMPGAFQKSIARWQEKGDPVPVIWSHDWQDPFAHIGAVDPGDLEEVEKGLLVRGRLDVDKPFAKQVYDLLRGRRVTEFSFAYDVMDEREGDDRANELWELDLLEVGPTLKGANPSTELLRVKSLERTQIMEVLDRDVERVTFTVEGMTCSGCEASVRHELNKLDGILEFDVSFASGTAAVAYIRSKLTEDDIRQAINKTGFTALK